MTTFIPGAVYVTRGDPLWLPTLGTVAGQFIGRDPRNARATHAMIAVSTHDVMDLGPDNHGNGVDVYELCPGSGDWYRAIVPPLTDRLDIVAAAWAMHRAIHAGDADIRFTYRACAAALIGRPPRPNEMACSTFAAHIAAIAGVDLIPGCPWYAVTPADIARRATTGSDF